MGKSIEGINKKLTKDELDTLTCTTPNKGYHYVYKLSDEQKEGTKFYNGGQVKLFDLDIDVLYNSGRLVMAGVYGYDGKQYIYKIINDKEPIELPEILFDEIIKRRDEKNKCEIKNGVKTIKEVKINNQNIPKKMNG